MFESRLYNLPWPRWAQLRAEQGARRRRSDRTTSTTSNAARRSESAQPAGLRRQATVSIVAPSRRAGFGTPSSSLLGSGGLALATWLTRGCKAGSRVISALLATVLVSGVAAPQALSDPGRAENALERIARIHSTPERLANFLNAHLTFHEDQALFGQVDYWQSPEEVFRLGKGDCEDYALLASDLLARQGVRTFVFSLYGKNGYAHTVCVFVQGGRYGILNQDRLVRSEASSLEGLAGELCRDWEWGAIAERRGHRGRAVKIIRRTT